MLLIVLLVPIDEGEAAAHVDPFHVGGTSLLNSGSRGAATIGTMPSGPQSLPRRVTIRDVARASGTSISTVSVALSGRSGVSQETRSRVIDTANRLGWRPDRRASNLRRQDSRQVGFVYEVEQTFQAQLIDAMYVAAAEHGLELVLAGATVNHNERVCVSELLRDRCQAIVLTGSGLSDEEMGRIARRLPTLSLGRHVCHGRVDVVVSDDRKGLDQAVGFLASCGHERIAYVDGGPENPISERRFKAFRQAIAKHGLDDSLCHVAGGVQPLDGVHAARQLVAMKSPPSAVICYNDVVAAALVRELRVLGRKVPREVSVVGYDDGPEGRDPSTSLTTIRQDPTKLADAAMGLIRRRIDDEAIVSPGDQEMVVLPVELVIRESTGPVRV